MNKVWNRHDPACPADAVYVGRPTVFGNPFSHRKGKGITVESRHEAVERYKEYLDMHPHLKVRARTLLRGQDLVCWCVLFGGAESQVGHPECHAFVLMEIANK